MTIEARWGTRFELSAGRGRILDRAGHEVARLDGERAWLRGAPGHELSLEPAPAPHPIFGPALRLVSAGRPCTVMGAVEWAAPTTIPPVAEPGALPAHTGTALLNLISACAVAAGVARVQYRGPYPTPALYASLAQCFVPLGDEATFTAGAADLLLAPRMVASAVAFTPAPFERWWPAPRVGVQARQRIERVFIDGAAFDSSGAAVRRLVAAEDDPGLLRAELWFGDARWAVVAELSDEGAPLRGPLALPVLDDPIVGQEVPAPLRRALAELIVDGAPAPLAPLLPRVLERATIRWGDAGLHAARATDEGALLHAALWLTLRPHGGARLALAMAEALTPWAVAAAVRAAAP
ncbi:MAG: hypothetical protein IPI49_30895 [Myxococcales bacterium]|nr:hypothetical protein [Myxococcales bacterium]